MKEQIKQYIIKEIKKLKNECDIVELVNVYPSILEEVLGDFNEPYELNGYDCDYWANTDVYEIFGTMRFATAKITLRKAKTNTEYKKEEIKTSEIKEEPIILRITDVSQDILKNLNTYYFTFGYGQKHEGYYQPIMAKDKAIALKKMVEIYKTKWAFQYDEKEWESCKKYYINKALEIIVAL